jgi:predicted MFS family arabinose efflux permease
MILPTTAIEKHNARQLYGDMFWYGVLSGSALAFLPVYAARLGASSLQIGLLTAGPALVSLLVSMPAARWLESRSVIRASFQSSVLHRLGYLALLAMPLLAGAGAQLRLLPLLVVLMSVPGTFLAISFNAMLADIVPPEARAHVIGRRVALLGLSTLTTSLACGWLLDRVVFPLNYEIVFGIGTVGAGLSSLYLARIRAGTNPPQRVGQALQDSAWRLLRFDLVRGRFGVFLVVMLLFYTFQSTSIPLMAPFWVGTLHLSDGTISLGNALLQSTLLLASFNLVGLSRRFGGRRVLAVSASLYGLYPFLNGLSTGPELFLIASVLGGIVWGLASSGLATRLMERVPENDRPAHMALFNLALNFGILGGSFLGPALAAQLGLRDALLAAGALRALAGILIAIWG